MIRNGKDMVKLPLEGWIVAIHIFNRTRKQNSDLKNNSNTKLKTVQKHEHQVYWD